MKRYFLLYLFSLCSMLLVAQSKFTVIVTEYPPLTSETISSKGLLAEILTAVFEGTPYSFDYHFFPLARINIMRNSEETAITFAVKGRFDKEKYWFQPICISKFVFFYKKANYPSGVSDSNLSELTQFRTSILNDSPMLSNLKKAGFEKIDLSYSAESSMKKLALDRVDLVMTVDYSGLYILNTIGENPNDYAMTEGTLQPATGFLVSKSLPNSEDIVKTFIAGYSKIKANGKLKAILESYLGKGQIPTYFIQ